MIDVITTERIPIKCWTEIKDIEEGALVQLKNIANLPFAYGNIVSLPGIHQGYGMPIESVLATNSDVVVPYAVGSDIGCGMQYVITDLPATILIENDKLRKSIKKKIKEVVPVGFNKHKEPQSKELVPNVYTLTPIINKELENSLLQIGTLGSGNHFIELQASEENKLGIMLHSGSRHMGAEVCKCYYNAAKYINTSRYLDIPENLYFLCEEDEDLFHEYIASMNFCIEFAKVNRTLMMSRIIDILFTTINSFSLLETADVIHNYAALERHFGKNVLVHRKGAISAKMGEIGIIPGSQGTKSYIVKGLGNRQSFMSCSHGAGRRLSRTAAKKKLDLQKVKANLNNLGISHSVSSIRDLEEAPEAYKDIDNVILLQNDLVEVIHTLTPILNVKG